MKANELRNKSVVELRDEITALLREQVNLKIQRGLGTPPKPHLFKQGRRKIATILTILREKAGE
jgi:large subunit ribosomal protein L29